MKDEIAPAPGAGMRGAVTVVTILREPLELTLRFVAWYLELGAARLDLYFDDPDDPAIELLAGIERVSATRCTPAFWRSLGADPEARFTLRQNLVLTHAYQACDTAWVLNVDADELLWLGDRRLRRFAARQPDEVRAVRFMPAEVVQTDEPENHTWFRYPMRRRHLSLVYGEDRPLFRHRAGLVGHTEGKSMIRTGLAIAKVRQHWAQDAEGNAIADKVVGKRQNAVLLHFLDNGYDHWRQKAGWRLSASGFSGRVRDVLAGADQNVAREEDFMALYRRLHHFDATRLERLKASGRALCLNLDFDAPRRRVFA